MACLQYIRIGLSLLPAVAAAAAGQTNALDLTEAIQRALDQNRSVLSAGLAAQASAWGIDQQAAEFDFRLVPEGNASANDSISSAGAGLRVARKVSWGTDISAGGDFTRTESDGVPAAYVGRVLVRVDQPLFREAGRLVQLEPTRLAESRYRRSLRMLEDTKADVVLSVVDAYHELLRLQGLVASDDASLQRLDKLSRITAVRERQGRTTRVDSLRVDLQLGQARTRRENRLEQLAAQQRAFADLLGDPPDHLYALAPPPRLALDLPAPDAAVALALSNRLDYAQVQQDLDDARRGERVAGKQLQPDVRLTTQVQQEGAGLTADDATSLDDTRWFVGLSSGSDVLQAREHAALRGAAVQTSAAMLDAEVARVRIVRDVQDRLGAYHRAAQEADIAAANLELARRRLHLAGRLFEMGRMDNFSVTDAEEAFRAAESDAQASEAEAAVNGYRVLRAMGTLIDYPEELKPKGP